MNSKRKLFILISLIVGLIFTGSLIADTSIFYCDETGAWGLSWNDSLSRVRKTARQYCVGYGGKNCQELLYCQEKGYGAIATDDEGSIGATCGKLSQAEADDLALANCIEISDKYTTCKVVERWYDSYGN
jgi:hypothetical protein